MIVPCPRCQQRIMTSNNDVIHQCNSGDAILDNESVRVIGNWEDHTGSGTVHTRQITYNYDNELQGTDAGIRGAKLETLNRRGLSTNIYRERQHLEYVEVPKEE